VWAEEPGNTVSGLDVLAQLRSARPVGWSEAAGHLPVVRAEGISTSNGRGRGTIRCGEVDWGCSNTWLITAKSPAAPQRRAFRETRVIDARTYTTALGKVGDYVKSASQYDQW